MTRQTHQEGHRVDQCVSQFPEMLAPSRSGRLPDVSVEAGPGAAVGPTPVLAFVGRSGSGKTTLLLKLIPALLARQMRVAVVKHSSHRGLETDVAGSDSRRFWDAGAREVALVTPDRVAHTRRVESEPRLDEVLAVVGSVDLILLEGFKCSDVLKIEVIRAACTSALLEGLSGRVACVTDVAGLGMDCPVFGLDDVEGVVDFLIEYMSAFT